MKLNEIHLPAACGEIIRKLNDSGHAAYAVGGCIRDSLLGRTPHDWDITTSAVPQEVLSLFPGQIAHTAGLKHGTVALLLDGEVYEVTTFRVDGTYSDSRRPDSVRFTSNITEDLARRDFTVNAMAYNDAEGLIDPFGGAEDLKKRIVRCVGDPERRFSEDALRLFRAVRFSAELGFSIEPETLTALKAGSEKISGIAVERIFEELKRTAAAPQAAAALRAAPELLFAAVPELRALEDVPQNTPYHCYDVWEHTLHALEFSPRDAVTGLAILFHDTGKKACRTTDGNGRDHFFGHAEKSAEITRLALQQLHADNATVSEVTQLVLLHDTPFDMMRSVKFRRLLAKIGFSSFFRLMDVARADSAAHAPEFVAARLHKLEEVEKEAKRLQSEDFCLTLAQLKLDGKALMELGLSGPSVGEALHVLLDEVIDGRLENDLEKLLRRAEKFAKKRQQAEK